MKIKQIFRKLDTNLAILITLVLIAIAATTWKGGWQLTFLGLTSAGQLVQKVGLYVMLGLVLGGMAQKLIPSALIAKWLGHASGFKGIFIGSYIGIFIPAGPFSFMPIIASIYKAGAGVGPIIALYAGRAMLSLQILVVWQIPILGLELPLSRFLACLFLPPFVGIAGKAVYQLVSRDPKPDGDCCDSPDVTKHDGETDNIE